MSKGLKRIRMIFVLVFIVYCYFLLRDHYEQRQYDANKIPIRKTTDYGSVLRGVFEQRNWNNLQLSENFRKKYKTKFDITKDAGRFVRYSNGSVYENGEELITIDYQTESFFDFDYSKCYQMDLYFRYKVTDDGLLDDVEFVRKEKRNKMTGRIIEE